MTKREHLFQRIAEFKERFGGLSGDKLRERLNSGVLQKEAAIAIRELLDERADSSVEVREIYDDSGCRIGEAQYVDGKPQGKSRLWTSEGQLILESHFRSGEYDGSYQTWWDNGNPKEVGVFVNGRRIGVYRWFSESGELIEERDYGDAQ